MPSHRKLVPPDILARHVRGGAEALANVQEPPIKSDDDEEEPWEVLDEGIPAELEAPAGPEDIWDRTLEEMLAGLGDPDSDAEDVAGPEHGTGREEPLNAHGGEDADNGACPEYGSAEADRDAYGEGADEWAEPGHDTH